jgi:hypothetical protein
MGRILATAIIACVIGCAPGPVDSRPSSSGSPLGTASPSAASATAWPTGAATPQPSTTAEPPSAAPPSGTTSPPFAPDSIAVTVSDRLLVRSKPGLGKESKELTPLLPVGTRLFVIKGPVPASGYDWYLVEPLAGAGRPGWVAAGDRSGKPWIAVDAVRCPPRPDLKALATLDGHVALACYGHQEIELTVRLGGFDGLSCPDTPPFSWTVTPSWLDPCSVGMTGGTLTPLTGDPEVGYFVAPFDPTIDRRTLPEQGYSVQVWTTVKVTGQYDHPAARGCRAKAVPDGVQPPRPEAVVVDCRAQFVITSIQVVR